METNDPYRPDRPFDREATTCTGCGIALQGTVTGSDGGSHGRSFEPVPYCRRCAHVEEIDTVSGPGYGPVPCWPADTPEGVRDLEGFLLYAEGHPHGRRKFREDFAAAEFEAILALREAGYVVRYYPWAPGSDRQHTVVYRRHADAADGRDA